MKVPTYLRRWRSALAAAWPATGTRDLVESQAALRRVTSVVAAGERWPGDQLRPAVEDLWGAGAVIANLLEFDFGSVSPEGSAAAAAFREVAPKLRGAIRTCASGQELIADGFGDEIAVAAEQDVSAAVPVLQGESFRKA